MGKAFATFESHLCIFPGMSALVDTVRYSLALTAWEDEGALHVRDTTGQDLLIVPVAFLAKGKVDDKLGFVKRQIFASFVCSAGYLSNARGGEATNTMLLEAGVLTFTPTDDTRLPLMPRIGPRFKFRSKPPIEGGDSSTMSNSRRSSANQSKFREALCARDTKCLVTGTHYTRCTAAHIIPQSRPEYYREILGYDPGFYFLASYGLLLSDDLHHSFDRGEWALCPEGDNLIVHMFRPSDEEWKRYHGLVIVPTRFHTTAAERPDRRLLQHHYNQCSMMRFRGFWCPTDD